MLFWLDTIGDATLPRESSNHVFHCEYLQRVPCSPGVGAAVEDDRPQLPRGTLGGVFLAAGKPAKLESGAEGVHIRAYNLL